MQIGEGNGNPLQCSCLENPRDGGTWWAAVYGVSQSRTRLKWLSSSNSRFNAESFRFSTLTVFSSVNRLFYFFLSTLECLAFHFLALLYLLKPPVQCWAKVVGVDILVLFLILGRKYLFFKIKYDTSCSFSIDVLTRLRILISILVFWEFFKWEWILDYFLPNAFSTFFEMIRYFFSFLVF